MTVYFSAEHQGIFARAGTAWAMRHAVAIAEKTLRELKVFTPLLRDKIAANLILAGCIRNGRIASDRVRQAAFLIFDLIPEQQRPEGLNIVHIENAINKVREKKVRIGEIPLRLLGVVPYHQLSRLVLDERGRRRLERASERGNLEFRQAGALAAEIERLQQAVADLTSERGALLERVAAGGRLVAGVGELMRATLRTADLDGFLHEVAELAYRAVGCDRAIIFMYDRGRNALVANKHPRGNPYAGKDQAKIADIEAFLEGELVVPLDAAGQKDLSHKLIRRAVSLSLTRQPGSETARRLLKNLPMLIRGYRSEGRELRGREAELSLEYEVQERFMRANLEALEYGFTLDYEGTGENKKVILSKNIVGTDRRVQRVVLEEFSVLELHSAPEFNRIREASLPAATEILGSESLTEMLLGTAVFRAFFTRSEGGRRIVPVRKIGERDVSDVKPSREAWEKIWEPSESIISLTYKTGRGYRVKVDNPQVKVNPALIAMWGTTAFATAPIVQRQVSTRADGSTVEAEEVIGMLGLDNDVSRTEFTDEAMSALQSLADIVALQYRLFRHRASLEDVIRKVFKPGVGEGVEAGIREGGLTRITESPARGVLLYTGVCGSYEGNTGKPAVERPKTAKDGERYESFLAAFKQTVAEVASKYGGVFAGGDQRSSYLFWGAPEREVSTVAGYAGRALEASFELESRVAALRRGFSLLPPVLVCTGIVADTIQTGVVEVDGEPTLMVKGSRVKRVVEVAEQREGTTVSPEVVEGLDEVWKLALLDGAVKGIAANLPRMRMGRSLINSHREIVVAWLEDILTPYNRALDAFAADLITERDEKERETYELVKENSRRLVIDHALGIMGYYSDFSPQAFLPSDKIGEMYALIAEKTKETLVKQAGFLVTLDYGLCRQFCDGIVGLVSIAVVEKGKDRGEILASAEQLISSIISSRHQMQSKKGLEGNTSAVALVRDFMLRVIADVKAYEEVVEESKAAIKARAADPQGPLGEMEVRCAAARDVISTFCGRLWQYWHPTRPKILYTDNTEFILEARHWEEWEGIVESVNRVWQGWNTDGGKVFEEYFVDHVRRQVEASGVGGRRTLAPLNVVGRARLEPSDRLLDRVMQVDEQAGILRPVLDRKNGRITGYTVDYSLNPHDSGFGHLAQGVVDLLALRYLQRVAE